MARSARQFRRNDARTKVRAHQIREKAALLRSRVRMSVAQALQKHSQRVAWWSSTFHKASTAFSARVFEKASSLCAAVLLLIGLTIPKRRNTGSTSNKAKRRRKSHIEQFEPRMVLDNSSLIASIKGAWTELRGSELISSFLPIAVEESNERQSQTNQVTASTVSDSSVGLEAETNSLVAQLTTTNSVVANQVSFTVGLTGELGANFGIVNLGAGINAGYTFAKNLKDSSWQLSRQRVLQLGGKFEKPEATPGEIKKAAISQKTNITYEEYVEFPAGVISNLSVLNDDTKLTVGIKFAVSAQNSSQFALVFGETFNFSSEIQIPRDEGFTMKLEASLNVGVFKSLVNYPTSDPTLIGSLADYFIPFYGDSFTENALAVVFPNELLDLTRSDTPLGLLSRAPDLKVSFDLGDSLAVGISATAGAKVDRGLLTGSAGFQVGVSVANVDSEPLEGFPVEFPNPLSVVGVSRSEVASVVKKLDIKGVTVVVHGFQPPDTSFLTWGDSLLGLADQIRFQSDLRNGSGSEAWLLDFDVLGNGAAGWFDRSGYQSILESIKLQKQTGHIVLLYDWAADSSKQTQGWAESAGEGLFSMLVELGLVKPENSTLTPPIHFIGHSMGTVVVSEAVERLDRLRIPVDQVTYLDPHDFDQNGIPFDTAPALWTLGRPSTTDGMEVGYGASVWNNVHFTDVYYQTKTTPLNPSGRPIPGAFNFLVNNFVGDVSPHSDVWSSFYLSTVTNTNSQIGYAFSQVRNPGRVHLPLPDFDGFPITTNGFPDHRYTDPVASNSPTRYELAKSDSAWDPMSIFNGSFEYAEGADIPGWTAPYGGGGAAQVRKITGDRVLVFSPKDSQHRRIHNKLFVPKETVGVEFDIARLDYIDDGATPSPTHEVFPANTRWLTVKMDNRVIKKIDVSTLLKTAVTYVVPIPSDLRGTVTSLEFVFESPVTNGRVQISIDDVRFVAGGYSGDLLPVDLRVLQDFQGREKLVNPTFSGLSFQIWNTFGSNWDALTTEVDAGRGDWRLTRDGITMGYVLFPGRIEGGAPYDGPDATGRFYFAPGLGGNAFYDNVLAPGFQGRIRVQFAVDGVPKIQELHVADGFTVDGDRSVDNSSRGNAALQQRLNYFGYRDAAGQPLVVDAIIGPKTMEAIGLFNASVADSVLLVPSLQVSRAINSLSAPRWTQLLAGKRWSMATSAIAAGETWATSFVQDVLTAADDKLQTPLIVRRASRRSGGEIPQVIGHVAGRDLEIESGSSPASSSEWSTPFYRTTSLNGIPTIAAKTVDDPRGDRHLVRQVIGLGLQSSSNSKRTFRLFSDAAGQSIASLDGIDNLANAPVTLVLQPADGQQPFVREVESLNPLTGEVTLKVALETTVNQPSLYRWSLFHAIKSSMAIQYGGIVAHSPANANDQVLLMGIAALIVDPVIGYRVASVKSQVEALRAAAPSSGARVMNVWFNDPRLWGLPNTISSGSPISPTEFRAGASGPLRIKIGTVASARAIASAVSGLKSGVAGQKIAESLDGLKQVPLVGKTNVGSGFALADQITTQTALVGDMEQASSMTEVANSLTASGFVVDYHISDDELGLVDTSTTTDYIRFHKNISFNFSGNYSFDQSELALLSQLSGVTFAGQLTATASMTFELYFGVDQDGLYWNAGQVGSALIKFSGNVSGGFGQLGSASATATVDLQAGIWLRSPEELTRMSLTSASFGDNSWSLDATLLGVAKIDSDFSVTLPWESPLAFKGSWEWLIGTNSVVLNSSKSGFKADSLLASLMHSAEVGLGSITGNVDEFVGIEDKLPIGEESIATAVESLLSEQFQTRFASIQRADLASQGITITSELTPASLVASVVNGQLPSGLIEFSFSKNLSHTKSVSAGGSLALPAGVSAFDANLEGSLVGSINVGMSAVVGVDFQRGVYVREGNWFTGGASLIGQLNGSASVRGLASVALSASGGLALSAVARLNDNDAIPNEAIYIPGADFSSYLNEPSVSGGVTLDQLSLTANIPALDGLLPDFKITGTGSYDFVTGVGSYTVNEDAMLDGLIQWVFSGLDRLSESSEALSKIVENVPFVGKDLAPAIRTSLQSGFHFDSPIAGVRSYLVSKGFDVISIVSLQQLLSGNVGANDLLVLGYHQAVSPAPIDLAFNGDLKFGAAALTMGGNLRVAPVLNYSLIIGLDLTSGPFLREGSTLEVSLPLSGRLAGKASIGNLAQIDATAQATMQAVGKATFSDFDTLADERYYLISSRTKDAIKLDEMFNSKDALKQSGNLTLDLNLTLDNPSSKLPVIGEFLGSALSWNAVVGYDLFTGQGSYSIQQDGKFGQLVDIFTNAEQGLVNLAMDRLDQYNPLPQELRDFLTDDLPVLNESIVDYVGLPETAKLVLNPLAFKNKRAAEIDPQPSDDDVDVTVSASKSETIKKLLSGQDADLISFDVHQSFDVGASIPVLAAPVFSLFGVVNFDVAVNVLANLALTFDVQMGIDTQGFYIQEAQSSNDYAVEISGTIAGELVGTGRLVILPFAQISTNLGLIASGGVRLSSNDGDEKLRVNELLAPSNIEIGIGVDLGLNVEAELGFPNLGLSAEFVVLDEKFPLYRAVGGGADVNAALSQVGDKIMDQAQELALKAINPVAMLSQLGEAAGRLISNATETVSAFVGDTTQAINQGIADAGKQADQAAKQVVQAASQLYENAGKATIKLGRQALAGVGISDPGSIFGAGDFTPVDVPERRTFDAEVVNGTLYVTAFDQHEFNAPRNAQLIIAQIEDGRILIDGPDFVEVEEVGYRKSSCWNGCNKDWVNEEYLHFNRQLFSPGQFSRIVVYGTDFDDEILVETSMALDTTILGFEGNDTLVGGSGNDILQGGPGNDRLFGGRGRDKLYGEANNDLLVGGDDSDTLQGGTGDDVLDDSQDRSGNSNLFYGESGDDILLGSAGDDEMYGGAGRDVLDGLAGNDQLYGESGPDLLLGRDGNDRLFGGSQNDYLEGGAGGDTLDGGSEDDTLQGDNADGTGDGADILFGRAGNDVLKGGGNRDELYGNGGADKLFGEDGDDLLVGASPNDFEAIDDLGDELSGGDGADDLYGGRGDDVLYGGHGNDRLYGGSSNDSIDGGAGNNFGDGGDGNDVLLGEKGIDDLYGGAGDDVLAGSRLHGGDGNDTLRGTAGDDSLWGDADEDKVIGLEGNDSLYGGSGNDELLGGPDSDQLFGDAGMDRLSGGDGSDLLDGGDDADQLSGEGGADRLFGKAGNDLLLGGTNSDTLEGGDGSDRLEGAEGSDELYGGSGDDVMLGGLGNDTMYGQAGKDLLFGDAGNDMLDGGSDADTLNGESGNDSLYGRDGDDALLGGQGFDKLYGGADSDRIEGGTEDDSLWGEDGNDQLKGEAGNDRLDGGSDSDELYGGDDQDTLLGGSGDDTLFGDGGDDSLSGENGDDTLFGGAGSDLLIGGWGQDVLFGGLNNEGGGLASDRNILHGDVTADSLSPVPLGNHDDNLYGDVGNDQLYGREGDDTLFGLGGGDSLYGGVGNDRIDGGEGNDLVYGNSGDDQLIGGQGNDTLYGGSSAAGNGDAGERNTIYGDSELTSTPIVGISESYADTIYGAAGSDTVYGGYGKDVIFGMGGADTLDGGDQDDELLGGNGDDILRGGYGNDVLHGNAGIDVLYGDQGQDRLYGDVGANDGSLVGQELHGGADDDELYAYSASTLTTTTSPAADQREKLFGDAGNDRLYGNAGADYLSGGDGNDELYGDWLSGPTYVLATMPETIGSPDILVGDDGNDILKGGGGNDQLWGSKGMDTIYGQGGTDASYGGSDVDLFILDIQTPTSSPETMDGHRGNAPGDSAADDLATDVLVIQGDQGNTLEDVIIVSEDLATKQMLIAYTGIAYPFMLNWRNSSTSMPLVEQVQIIGGQDDDIIEYSSTIDLSLLKDQRDWNAVISGGPGNDKLFGGSGRDHLDGGPGSDKLYGSSGDDRLYGNKVGASLQGDHDELYGGQGNDDLIAGDNSTVLSAWSFDPKTGGQFGVYVSESGQLFENSGDFVGATDSAGLPIPDGKLDSDPSRPARKLEDTGLNRSLGSAKSDLLYGGTGVDFLYGNGGNDTLHRADGTEFEELDEALGGDAWKSFARQTNQVWYVGATDTDDVIAVDYVTEPGVLQERHLVTRLTNNNGNFSFSARVHLDFEATNAAGARLWDPRDIVLDVEAIQAITDPAARQIAYDELQLNGGLLPPEGNFQVILIDALGGNDKITVGPTVQKTVWIDAGAGDDRVEIKSGSAILIDPLDANDRNDRAEKADYLNGLSITSVSTPPTSGRIAEDVVLTFSLGQKAGDVTITLRASDTSTNNAVLDLVDDFSNAIVEAGIADLLQANLTTDGRLVISSRDLSESQLKITYANSAAMAIGFRPDQLAARQLFHSVEWSGLTLDSDGDVDFYRLNLASSAAGILSVQSVDPTEHLTLQVFSGSSGSLTGLPNLTTTTFDLSRLAPNTNYTIRVQSSKNIPTKYVLKAALGGEIEAVRFAKNQTLDRRDVILGGAGNDVLAGGPSQDWIFGQAGDDLLTGGLDTQLSDLLFGGSGNDTLQAIPDQLRKNPVTGQPMGVTSADEFNGGLGVDSVLFLGGDLDRSGQPVPDEVALTYQTSLGRYELSSSVWDIANKRFIDNGSTKHYAYYSLQSVEQTVFDLRAGDDLVKIDPNMAGPLRDVRMEGGAGDDVLVGGSGDDTLDGGDGNDVIRGGGGNDTIRGGSGDDQLDGNSGTAVPDALEFVLRNGTKSRNDDIAFATELQLGALTQDKSFDELTFDRADTKDWYAFATPFATHTFNGAGKAYVSKDDIEVLRHDGGEVLLFNLHAVSKTPAGQFTSLDDVSVVPDFYAIEVLKPDNDQEVASYSVRFKSSIKQTVHADLAATRTDSVVNGTGSQSVAIRLGDINGDGKEDLITSVRDQVGDFAIMSSNPDFRLGTDDPANFIPRSEAIVTLGASDSSTQSHVTLLLPAPVTVGSTFGTRSVISSPGDYNNDGIQDLAVAVYREFDSATNQLFGANPNFTAHGVYIVFGSTAGWPTTIDIEAQADLVIDGFSGGRLSIASVEDFNFDSKNDLAIGDPDSYSGRGRVSILLGDETIGLRTWSSSDLLLGYTGTSENSHAGIAVSGTVQESGSESNRALAITELSPDNRSVVHFVGRVASEYTSAKEIEIDKTTAKYTELRLASQSDSVFVYAETNTGSQLSLFDTISGQNKLLRSFEDEIVFHDGRRRRSLF